MIAADYQIQRNVPLAPLTTLGIGGPARYFLRARDDATMAAGVRWASERQLPLLVLGGGSNLVVADAGFPGLVLRIAVRGVETHRADGMVEVMAGAGEPWSALVAYTVDRGWAGLECLAGIPGLVGATPVQNVGAYGQEVREMITRVEALDVQTGQLVIFANDACAFGYRESRFKVTDRGRYLITRVGYRLVPGGSPSIRYSELALALANQGISQPTVTQVHAAVLAIRRHKSMLLHPHDPNTRSAGSFFINPLLAPADFAALEEVATSRAPGDHLPRFMLPDGRVKVPAAWLIERVGFERGYTLGNVGLSTRHTLALVNRGGATACEVVALARLIRDRVRETFGITLVPEPALIGLSLDII